MKIAVDAFGGDNAPLSVIRGAHDAAREYGVNIILTGDKDIIEKCAADNKIDLAGIEIRHTDSVFDMHDKPTDILKSKRGTSLGLAMDLVANGEADAFVSAGSTGAIMAGATFIVKRIKGIERPAIGTVIPTMTDRKLLLMDAGANAECRPEMLRQFGIMASLYLENAEGIKDPEIGLLNIGTEDTKGGPLQIEAYKLLKESPVNFVGNIEARELPAGVCDAVISDGFTGNVVLKLYEGVASNMMKLIKRTLMSTFRSKIAALLAKKSLYSLKDKMNYDDIGGAPLLGVKKPVIKAHGSSNADAIKNAIKQAKRCAENDVAGKISADLQKIAADEK